MIFVDSSAWYAVFSLRDTNHAIASQTVNSFQEELVTSDYVVDETLTLLRSRGENRRALAFGQRVLVGGWAQVIRVDDNEFQAAWNVFQNYNDKQWSFTDCTSRVLMERLGIKTAFAFDEHFRQFGTVAIVP